MDEKPLHVRVAEAIGWTNVTEGIRSLPGMEIMWIGRPPQWDTNPHNYVAAVDHAERRVTINAGSIPRYDTDWAATGPLIERFRLSLNYYIAPETGWHACLEGPICSEYGHEREGLQAWADTPPLAVCNLILALSEAGKLPKETTVAKRK